MEIVSGRFNIFFLFLRRPREWPERVYSVLFMKKQKRTKNDERIHIYVRVEDEERAFMKRRGAAIILKYGSSPVIG